jgi:hypothetical protein
MEHERSFQCSQVPATGPYPEPDESSPHPHFFKRYFSIALRSVRVRLQNFIKECVEPTLISCDIVTYTGTKCVVWLTVVYVAVVRLMPAATHIRVANVAKMFEKLCSNSEVPVFHVICQRSTWQGMFSGTMVPNLWAAALIAVGLNTYRM